MLPTRPYSSISDLPSWTQEMSPFLPREKATIIRWQLLCRELEQFSSVQKLPEPSFTQTVPLSLRKGKPPLGKQFREAAKQASKQEIDLPSLHRDIEIRFSIVMRKHKQHSLYEKFARLCLSKLVHAKSATT